MILYLRISIHKHFQVWFLIGKNYILQRKNTGFFYNYKRLWTHQHYCWHFKTHASQVISKVRISKDVKRSSSGRFILNTLLLSISKHSNTYTMNFCNGNFNQCIWDVCYVCFIVVVVILIWRSTLKRFRHLVLGVWQLVNTSLII